MTEKAWKFILENFVSIAKESNDFLELNVDDFFAIINDELLNTKVKLSISSINFIPKYSLIQDEHVVWESLLKWIDHDAATRKVHLEKLMSGVRLGLLSNSVS